MLRVCQLSGQEIARLDKEFVRTLQEKKYGNSVRALKWHLSEAVGGVSIYCLKLIHGENPLEDACQLHSLMDDMGDMERNVEVMDLVLTILEYHAPTEDEEKTFLSAADAEKTLELESMLQLPMDPNGVIVAPNPAADNLTEVDMSPLILAANHGHLEAVELLLDAGADIEHMNSFDETALWFAACGNHIEVLRHLIFRGAALNSRNRNQETALMAAIQQGQAAAVDALIEAGYITWTRTDETLVSYYVIYWTELPNMTDEDTGSASSYRRLGYEDAEPDYIDAEDTGVVARSVASAEARRLAVTTTTVTSTSSTTSSSTTSTSSSSTSSSATGTSSTSSTATSTTSTSTSSTSTSSTSSSATGTSSTSSTATSTSSSSSSSTSTSSTSTSSTSTSLTSSSSTSTSSTSSTSSSTSATSTSATSSSSTSTSSTSTSSTSSSSTSTSSTSTTITSTSTSATSSSTTSSSTSSTSTSSTTSSSSSTSSSSTSSTSTSSSSTSSSSTTATSSSSTVSSTSTTSTTATSTSTTSSSSTSTTSSSTSTSSTTVSSTTVTSTSTTSSSTTSSSSSSTSTSSTSTSSVTLTTSTSSSVTSTSSSTTSTSTTSSTTSTSSTSTSSTSTSSVTQTTSTSSTITTSSTSQTVTTSTSSSVTKTTSTSSSVTVTTTSRTHTSTTTSSVTSSSTTSTSTTSTSSTTSSTTSTSTSSSSTSSTSTSSSSTTITSTSTSSSSSSSSSTSSTSTSSSSTSSTSTSTSSTSTSSTSTSSTSSTSITSSTTTTSTSSTTTTTFLGRIIRTQVLYKGIWVWRTFHEEFEVDNATFENSSLVPSDFALQDYTHIMMYLQSSFSEQSTPQVIPIRDAQASVSNVAFIDKDLDGGELGGQISWSPPTAFGPAAVNRALRYRLYVADTSMGINRVLLNYQVNTFRYLRFTAKKLRNESSAAGVQVAELSFLSNGQVVDLTSAVASNEGGSSPSNEGADKAIDSNSATKWFDYTNSPLQVQLATPLKVEVNGLDHLGRTALHTASQEKSVDVVSLLLESNADVNAETQDGDTPLSLACARTTARVGEGVMAVINAAIYPAGPIAKRLRTAGADLDKAALAAGRRIVERTLNE